MTEQQALKLKKRIEQETLDVVQAELARKNKAVWTLKLDNTKMCRKLSIVHEDEWEEIKQLWDIQNEEKSIETTGALG